MTIKVHKYTAPSAWACYLINGDATSFDGMHDNEKDAQAEQDGVDQWVEAIGFGSPVDCKEVGFQTYHDAWWYSPYAGDCCEYTFLEHTEEPA